MYSCQLWCNYSPILYRRLKVAFNNILRALLHIVRGASISQVFVSNNITDFNSLIRKTVYGFYQRVISSNNVLMETLLSSVYFVNGSILFTKWCNLLFMPPWLRVNIIHLHRYLLTLRSMLYFNFFFSSFFSYLFKWYGFICNNCIDIYASEINK